MKKNTKAKPRKLRKYKVEITFEWGKEPTAKIELLEKKLGITASKKGKLFYHYGNFDFLVAFEKLEKEQALQVIDLFSELNNFRYITLRQEGDV